MPIEYLGNKRRLLDFIVAPIVASGARSVGDLFCGTASVASALGRRGLRVVANDHLTLCATLAEASLLAPAAPSFSGLNGAIDVRRGESRYQAAVRALNELTPVGGFFFRTYSPASGSADGGRRYLTEANAARVDAIRETIAQWSPLLSRGERALLLRDLVVAVSRVSNTAGTYGCYLKRWKERALHPLWLTTRSPRPPAVGGHEVHCQDATAILPTVAVDAIYLDPPYTKRQYAAYYHLLETLVRGDSPNVTGSTGLPAWQDRRSDFCYRRRAASALSELVDRANVHHLFLSYSDEGHITHEQVVEILGGRGTLRWHERISPRYRSSALAHSASLVTERLYHLELS